MRHIAIGLLGLCALPLLAFTLALYGVYAGARWVFLRLAFGSPEARERALWTAR